MSKILIFSWALDVVVHEHLPAAHERGLSDLVRVQPAHMDEGDDPVVEVQGEGGHVLDSASCSGPSPGSSPRPGIPQDVDDDGYVVGGQIPDHVDVLLEEPQVDPGAAHVQNFPQFAALHDLLDLVHRGGVLKGVTHHEDPFFLFGQLDQFQTAFLGMGQGLFHQYMLTVLQKILAKG